MTFAQEATTGRRVILNDSGIKGTVKVLSWIKFEIHWDDGVVSVYNFGDGPWEEFHPFLGQE